MKLRPHITILACSVLFMVLSSTSCKDKNKPYCEENPGECSNIREVKDYFAFKQGSWWVYEEETSHERDSMYVTEYNSDLNSYDFNCRVISDLTGYEIHYFPVYASASNQCSPNGAIATSCIRVKKSKYRPGDYLGEDFCFMFVFKTGMYTYTYAANQQQEGNRIYIENVFSGFVLGDLNFGKTVKIIEQYTLVENQQSTVHYYSKGVGLIRKELLDSNEVWNLVNYHIEE